VTIKNYILTGATSGIGKAIAERLDSPNNHLILIGRSKEKLDQLASKLKASSLVIAIDLTDIELLSTISQKLPHQIDGYIHAAGVESVEPIKLVNYKKFDNIMRLHLYSFVEILKAIEKNKKKSDSYFTSVVVLSSVASDNGGIGQTMYASSKAALESAIRVLSKELAQKNIRINAIKPGIVNTEMTQRWMRRIGVDNIEDIQKMQLNGISEPSDIANLIEFLLSDISKHIVGTQIKIDGGGPSSKIF
jgi:short-subunit dehydrogenase